MPVPVDDPVLKLLLLVALILLAPAVAQRLRLPGIIGLILGGAAMGPHGLNLLSRDGTIELLAAAGLLYIMFIAGLEVDLHDLLRCGTRALGFGLLTFILPLTSGMVYARWGLGYDWLATVLAACMISSHTLLAYPIVSRLGIAKREAVTVAVGGTMVTDTLVLLVLAVVTTAASPAAGLEHWVRVGLGAPLVLGGLLWLGPPAARWGFQRLGGAGAAQFLFALGVVFGAGVLAHLVRLEPVIGAFVAGLLLNRLVPEQSTLMNRIQFFGHQFFIPLFLISVGMMVNLRGLAGSPQVWGLGLAFAALLVGAKLLAAWTARRAFGYGPDDGWLIFSLSTTPAAVTLAVVLVGVNLKLLAPAMLNAAVLVITVGCLLGPWVAERFSRRLALAGAPASNGARPRPQRLLVPMANPATSTPLVDFAMLVRDRASTEPISVLRVVLEEGDVREAVAESERLLGQVVIHGAGADVPVRPIIRVDVSPADGILRTVHELRPSSLILGWHEDSGGGDLVFGSVFDRVLGRCEERVLVCRLLQPLNTINRVVLALPPLADYEPGFADSVRELKTLTQQVGARLEVHCVAGGRGDLRAELERLRPAVPLTCTTHPKWAAAREALFAALTPANDLAVLWVAREGSIAWQPGVDRLPRRLATHLPTQGLVVVFPALSFSGGAVAPLELEAKPERPPPPAVLAALPPGGVVTGLDGLELPAALDRLLAAGFPAQSAAVTAMRDALLAAAASFAAELLPEVVLLHTHDAHVPRPCLLVGQSAAGVCVPGVARPAKLLLLILGAPDQPPAEHLQLLAALARLLRRPHLREQLLAAPTPDELRARLAAAAAAR